MKTPSLLLLLSLAIPPGFALPRASAATSALWGERGEYWSPQSRLPDFSYAGYQRGEVAIPNPGVTANVRNFGAVGNGVADDTAAFNNAIAATSTGAILVPAGRYKITNFVTISKSNIVLRGEGADRSILYFPKTLTDVLPDWGATTGGVPTSNYSWGGGFVRIQGSLGQTDRASVVTPFAKRSETWIPVSTITGFAVGQWVTVKASDDAAKSLSAWLYNGDSGSMSSMGLQTTTQVAKIAEIDTAGNRIRIDAPLRFDIRAVWSPKVQTFNPTVINSGVEDLGFEFISKPYGGHFTELGYNALQIQNAAHCWIRRIRIANSDSGVYLKGNFCTLDGVVFTSNRTPSGSDRGHHGITATGPDNLISNFDFQHRFIHDISVESAKAVGNVFQKGKGVDLSLDHHKKAPYANLFSNVNCGLGTRIWNSGGGTNLGKHTAGWATFWNMTASGNMNYPSTAFGPASTMNVVGLKTTQAQTISPTGKWFETMSPASLLPQNIYAAQLTRRIGTYEIFPEADTYARNGTYAGNNHGNESSVFIKTSSEGYTRHGYLRFNLQPLGGKPVLRAFLDLTANEPLTTTATRTVETRFVASDTWGETTLTWNNKPAMGALVATWVPSPDGWEIIDVTSAAKTEALGDRRLSLGLIVTAQAAADNLMYGSREAALANRPRLFVEVATP